MGCCARLAAPQRCPEPKPARCPQRNSRFDGKYSGDPPRQRNFPAGTARHINGLRADSRSGLNREFLQRHRELLPPNREPLGDHPPFDLPARPPPPANPTTIRPPPQPPALSHRTPYPTTLAILPPPYPTQTKARGSAPFAWWHGSQSQKISRWHRLGSISVMPHGGCGGQPSKSREIGLMENRRRPHSVIQNRTR
jgi:hypothetical protein